MASRKEIGGLRMIVEEYKCKFGKCKYNVGRIIRVSGDLVACVEKRGLA